MKKVAAVTAALGTLGGLAAAMEKAPGNIDKIINNGQKMAEVFRNGFLSLRREMALLRRKNQNGN